MSGPARVRALDPRPARAALLALALALLALAPAVEAREGWISIGALAGSNRPDPRLAGYQWDVAPRMAWGAQALAGAGGWSAGLRAWRAATTQEITGIASPTVRSTSLELVGRRRLAAWRGAEAHAMASVGRVHLGYDPDRIAVPSGSGTVEARLAPLDEWIGGGGLALARPLAGRARVGIEIEHRIFGLSTAYRDGGSIVTGRESFGEWNARLELAWIHRHR